jgi:hypothetical protein
MTSKPVRLHESVKKRLFDFIEGREVPRKYNRVGKMTPSEAVDLLFNTRERDNYIMKLFRMQHLLSSYLLYQENRWDFTIHHRDSDLVDCVRYFYEFLRLCPKEDSSNVRVRDFYQRLINTLKNLLDEYDNSNLHD